MTTATPTKPKDAPPDNELPGVPDVPLIGASMDVSSGLSDAGISAIEFADPADISTARKRKGAASDEFDAVVATCPRDKALRIKCAPGKARGIANRIGRSLARKNLKDVFTTGTDKDANGVEFAYLRPKPVQAALPEKKDA